MILVFLVVFSEVKDSILMASLEVKESTSVMLSVKLDLLDSLDHTSISTKTITFTPKSLNKFYLFGNSNSNSKQFPCDFVNYLARNL